MTRKHRRGFIFSNDISYSLIAFSVLVASFQPAIRQMDNEAEAVGLARDLAPYLPEFRRYVDINRATLQTNAAGAPVVITVADLVAATPSLAGMNGKLRNGGVVVGVARLVSGNLQLLITTNGGQPISDASCSMFAGAVPGDGQETAQLGCVYPETPSVMSATKSGRNIALAPFAGTVGLGTGQPYAFMSYDAAAVLSPMLYRQQVPGAGTNPNTMATNLRGGTTNDLLDFRDGRFNRNVVADGYLQARSVRSAGDACVTTGAVNDIGGLVQDSSGKPLYCDSVSGTFNTVGGGRPTVSFTVKSFGQGSSAFAGQAPGCPADSFELTGSFVSEVAYDPATGWLVHHTRWCWKYVQ